MIYTGSGLPPLIRSDVRIRTNGRLPKERRLSDQARTAAMIHDRQDRACLDAKTDIPFPGGGQDPDLVEPPRRYRRRSPVISQSLIHALTHSVNGVRGGTTDNEQAEIRRQRIETTGTVSAITPSAPRRRRRPSEPFPHQRGRPAGGA